MLANAPIEIANVANTDRTANVFFTDAFVIIVYILLSVLIIFYNFENLEIISVIIQLSRCAVDSWILGKVAERASTANAVEPVP
jgi:hypothetical protein